MNAAKLVEAFRTALQESLAPLHAELVRIRELLEAGAALGGEADAKDGREADAPLTAPGAPAAPGPVPLRVRPTDAVAGGGPDAQASPGAKETAVEAPGAEGAAAAAAATTHAQPAEPRAAARPPEPEPRAALLRDLLDDYPADAAAVYFTFDRQFRCAPEALDRLAREHGLEAAWFAANRASIRKLLGRHRGGLDMVAESLARDLDSLRALLERTALVPHVESVRDEEREHILSANTASRLNDLLYREKLLRDLGILEAADGRTRDEVRARCAQLSGDSDSPQDVLARLGAELGLDAEGLERLERRFELERFVADLYRDPEATVEPARRRGERREPPRHLEDDEIETRILRMLVGKRKVGASHTHIAHLVRCVPRHERGRARAIIDRLLGEGMLVLKTTDNSAEPHVSIAVAAMPQVEHMIETRSST